MSEKLGEEFDDLERRRASHRRWFYAKKPKRIDEVVAQLVQRKGYAQVRALADYENAWQEAVGFMASHTRVGNFRRGTLEITVENSLYMQELTFQKEELLIKIQDALPEANIKQIKFRIGNVK